MSTDIICGEVAAKLFCKNTKSNLNCPRKIKKDLILRIESSVYDYIESQPDASYDDITAQFGSPRELADSYISSLDSDEISKAIKKAKTIKIAVIVTCIIALIALFATFAKMISDNSDSQYKYHDETITDMGTVYYE